MPRNFWKIVNDVIEESDLVLLVLDARLVDYTRNTEIEEKIEKKGKRILYVINKSDLVEKKKVEEIKEEFVDCVFMSAKMHQGTGVLRREIMRLGRGEKVSVGVLGYPNVGKSSVINALSGGGKAPVGCMPGYTKGVQLLKVSQKLYMLDTPGVIPFMEKDETKHLLIGSKEPHKAHDPDIAAAYLLENNKNKVADWYGIEGKGEDGEELLEEIALKLNYMRKGGNPDIKRAAVKIILDWQKGKII